MPPQINIIARMQHPQHWSIIHTARPNQIRMHINDNANNSKIVLASIHHISSHTQNENQAKGQSLDQSPLKIKADKNINKTNLISNDEQYYHYLTNIKCIIVSI